MNQTAQIEDGIEEIEKLLREDERTEQATVITGKNNIERFRLCALKGALKMEVVGMKRRGPSAYSIVKQELGFKGSKAKVLEQLEELINKEVRTDEKEPQEQRV